LDRAIGDFLGSGQSDVISFTKLYFLPRGTYTFALAYDCAKAGQIVRGWLTAIELPRQGARE
jgi:hypothetical protein